MYFFLQKIIAFLSKNKKGQDKTCPYISTVTDAKLCAARICSISAT